MDFGRQSSWHGKHIVLALSMPYTIKLTGGASVAKINVPAFSGPSWKWGGGNLPHLSGNVCFTDHCLVLAHSVLTICVRANWRGDFSAAWTINCNRFIIVVVISQPHPQFPSGCGLRRAVARRNSGAMPSRWRRRTALRRFGVEMEFVGSHGEILVFYLKSRRKKKTTFVCDWLGKKTVFE